MTDTENKTDKPWIATLSRGRSYTLGTTNPISFQRGADVPVTDAVKKRLELKAVDLVNTGLLDDDDVPEQTAACKFVFRKVGDTPTSVSPGVAPRSRGGRRVHT